MTYFKINDKDFSIYVSGLKVNTIKNFNAQTNAASNTVIDFLNEKKQFEVTIIPLDSTAMSDLLTELDELNITITVLEPKTFILKSYNCFLAEKAVEFYTIQENNVSYQGFQLQFQEL